MEKKIAVIKGDGIGPEIVDEAIKALNRTAEVFGHKFEYRYVLMVGAPFSLSALCLSRALQPRGARLPSSSFEPSRVSASLRPNHKTKRHS